VLTLARRHALFHFARGLCGHFLKLLACCWLVAKYHSVCACACVSLVNCVCVCACVWWYMCMLQVFYDTVCWRPAPRQAHIFFFLATRLFANIDPTSLEGRAHASKSSQAKHISSQAWWSRLRCSCPDCAGHLTRRAPVLRTPGSDRVCSCHPRLTTPHFCSCGNETIRRKFCKRDLELTSIR